MLIADDLIRYDGWAGLRRLSDERITAVMVAREKLVRDLLGHWVSEIEPSLAFDLNGKLLGLCPADAPLGSEPFILTPRAAGIIER